ncbi:MAG: ATP-binding cassette domain-containing protein [Kouleothrix sp.]
MPNEPIIEIADLELRYRDLRAVAGLSLTIYAREVFGLLGPNGAGKTSTLACIEGLRQTCRRERARGRPRHAHDADVAKRLLGVQLRRRYVPRADPDRAGGAVCRAV